MKGKCDGRIFEYNTRTKTLSVVLNGLCFPNGVELTNDEKYLIVAESLGSRMIIVDRSTWKTKHTTHLRGTAMLNTVFYCAHMITDCLYILQLVLLL